MAAAVIASAPVFSVSPRFRTTHFAPSPAQVRRPLPKEYAQLCSFFRQVRVFSGSPCSFRPSCPCMRRRILQRKVQQKCLPNRSAAAAAAGLKKLFGDAVHCFFVEPVNAPCMLAAFAKGECVPVAEFGLSGKTQADGLAVGCASKLVFEAMRKTLSGCSASTLTPCAES